MKHAGATKLGLLVLVLLLTVSLFPFSAFAASITPLESINILAGPNDDGTTRVTFYAAIPTAAKLPATAVFEVPSDFVAQSSLGFDDSNNPVEATPKYTKKNIKGAQELTITFDEGHTVAMAFVIASSIYDPGQMGDVPLATLECKAPSDLKQLAIGFVTPEGRVGTGKSAVELGKDQDGALIVGQIFENVPKGETKIAQVAFPTQEAAVEGVAKSVAASRPFWQHPLILGLLAGILVLLVALIIYLLLRGRAAGVDSDAEQEEYAADDDIVGVETKTE